jgi:hypothetical protein
MGKNGSRASSTPSVLPLGTEVTLGNDSISDSVCLELLDKATFLRLEASESFVIVKRVDYRKLQHPLDSI